jgi:hypothetical protein
MSSGGRSPRAELAGSQCQLWPTSGPNPGEKVSFPQWFADAFGATASTRPISGTSAKRQ